MELAGRSLSVAVRFQELNAVTNSKFFTSDLRDCLEVVGVNIMQLEFKCCSGMYKFENVYNTFYFRFFFLFLNKLRCLE